MAAGISNSNLSDHRKPTAVSGIKSDFRRFNYFVCVCVCVCVCMKNLNMKHISSWGRYCVL